MRTFVHYIRRPRVWIPIARLILIVVTIGTACSENKVSKTHIKLEDRPQDKTSPASRPPEPLKCPSTSFKPLAPSATQTGHHRVFLRWDASKPSKAAPAEAVGYCIYRSATKDVAKKNPTCPGCEQVNVYPIRGTTCVDELVQDGATYYYVAAAITQNRDLSKSSNEVKVLIPALAELVGQPPPGPYPSCRAIPADSAPPSSHY
jgi:hypothetical protein